MHGSTLEAILRCFLLPVGATKIDGVNVLGHLQAMKHAFAMRSNLGDPGVCPANSVHGEGYCFHDMQPILSDMLSAVYAEKLRCCLPCF
jgi:hypothetical protein